MTKSAACAKKDGIERVEKQSPYGSYRVYMIPCVQCGDFIERKQYTSEKEYRCDYCKLSLKRKIKIVKQMELDKVRTKKEQAFDKAVSRIKKQVKNFGSYKDAISKAEKHAEKYGSIPEAMVAIELLKLKHKVVSQQKVGAYRVDFALIDLKLVIEVDGKLFHRDIYKGDREASIQFSLGLDWKIIHVPAELISNDIQKLKKVIKFATCNTREKK